MTRGHERPQTALAAAPSIDGAMSRLHQHEYWRRLPPPWNCETEEALLCTHVRAETHDVKSFFFRSPAGHAFAFMPGQFLTLELEIGGARLNRCYTISSPPTQPHTLSITVKRVPGGPVSNWLHDHLSAGMTVRTLGPAGVFSNALHPAERYLFLSAGSGITPLMSMARTHRDLCDDRDIVFVHSARTPDDIIFERELDLLASNLSRFRAHFVCEQLGRRPSWHGLTGRLSLPALALMAPDFLDRTVFTCGPALHARGAQMLAQAGLDMSRYHEESFSFDEQAAAPAPEPRATSTGSGFTVRFERSQRSLGCAADQTVLDAARAPACGCRPRARKACAAPARSGCCPARSTCAIRAASGSERSTRAWCCAAAAPERPDHREVSAGATSQIRQALFPSTVSIGQP